MPSRSSAPLIGNAVRTSNTVKKVHNVNMIRKPEAEIQYFDQKSFMDKDFLERKFEDAVFVRKRGLKYYDIKEFYFDI